MRQIFFVMSMAVIMTGFAWAADHENFLPGPYPDGKSVTKDCLNCHQAEAQDFLQTAHWLWKGPTPHVAGLEEGVKLGKRNVMNNF